MEAGKSSGGQGLSPGRRGGEKCMIHVRLEEAPTVPAWIRSVGVKEGGIKIDFQVLV